MYGGGGGGGGGGGREGLIMFSMCVAGPVDVNSTQLYFTREYRYILSRV